METLLIKGIIVQKMFRGENFTNVLGNNVTLLFLDYRTTNFFEFVNSIYFTFSEMYKILINNVEKNDSKFLEMFK